MGEILGWDRRKVSTYQVRGVLPKPVVQLYSGPIWFRKQIEFYKAGKDFGVRTYYIKGEMVYECTHNQPFKDTIYSPNDIKEQMGNYILYQEKDIQQLKNAILEKIRSFSSFLLSPLAFCTIWVYWKPLFFKITSNSTHLKT